MTPVRTSKKKKKKKKEILIREPSLKTKKSASCNCLWSTLFHIANQETYFLWYISSEVLFTKLHHTLCVTVNTFLVTLMVHWRTWKTSKAADRTFRPCGYLLSSPTTLPVPLDNSTINTIGPEREEVTREEWRPSIWNSQPDAWEDCNIIHKSI